MPFNSSGIYTLPNGYEGVDGQTILTSQHNPPLTDIQSALSLTFLRDGRAPMIANANLNNFKVINMANGSNPADAVTLSQLQALTPLGVPLPYLGTTAPSGHFMCFGQVASRTTYSALFAILGTTYGAGDGSTTFNLPDMRGRVLAGKDNMGGSNAGRLPGLVLGGIVGTNLGGVGGVESHVQTVAEMVSHGHGVNDPGHLHAYGRPVAAIDNDRGTQGSLWSIDGSETVNTSSAVTGISLVANGGGAAFNIVQPTIIVNYILRTGV